MSDSIYQCPGFKAEGFFFEAIYIQWIESRNPWNISINFYRWFEFSNSLRLHPNSTFFLNEIEGDLLVGCVFDAHPRALRLTEHGSTVMHFEFRLKFPTPHYEAKHQREIWLSRTPVLVGILKFTASWAKMCGIIRVHRRSTKWCVYGTVGACSFRSM